MRYWRALIWLVPVATLIPLGYFVYLLLTLDLSGDFVGLQIAGLVALVGIPELAMLAVSLAAAMLARARPLGSLIMLSAICAWALSQTVWQFPLWDSHTRVSYLVLSPAAPGAVSAVLAVWSWFMLHDSNRSVAIASAVLLLLPVGATVSGIAYVETNLARDCPPGPAIDLTFSGLENARFTTSCGIPRDASSLAECRFGEASIALPNLEQWVIQFYYGDGTVTSAAFPNKGPVLLAGGNSRYGGSADGGAPGWKGSYAFDPGSQCAGTVDADLYPPTGPGAGHVHVTGRFAAPQR